MTSATCPGQAALQPKIEGAHRYLRCVFSVEWIDTTPSMEVFYLTDVPPFMSYDQIEMLKSTVTALMTSHWNTERIYAVEYLGYESILMTPENIAMLDWRVITGTHVPDASTEAAPSTMSRIMTGMGMGLEP